GALLLEPADEPLAAGRGDDLVPVLLEDPGQGPHQRLIVVGDEDLGGGLGHRVFNPRAARDPRCRRSPRAPWGGRGARHRSAPRPWSRHPTVPPPGGSAARENV